MSKMRTFRYQSTERSTSISGIRSPGASPRPIAAEGFCGPLATLGDFIHSDHYHPWTLPMKGAHNHNAVR